METWSGGTDLKAHELEFDRFTGRQSASYTQSIHPLIPSLLLHQKFPVYCSLTLCEEPGLYCAHCYKLFDHNFNAAFTYRLYDCPCRGVKVSILLQTLLQNQTKCLLCCMSSPVCACIIKYSSFYYNCLFCVFTGKSERTSFIGYERDPGASGCQVRFSSDIRWKFSIKPELTHHVWSPSPSSISLKKFFLLLSFSFIDSSLFNQGWIMINPYIPV